MNKPTAQELWEKICKSLDWEYSPDGAWEKLEDQYTRELIQQYAQTYHDEEMDKFQLAHYVGVTHDNRLCFTDPQNPGAIIILNQPNQ